MVSWQEAKVSEEAGKSSSLWQWSKAGHTTMAWNARLRGDVQRRPGGFLDGQDKVRGAFYSFGNKGWSAQTPSLSLPLPYLSPYRGVGGLIQLVIFQDPMWTTLPRGEALEVSRASTSQCAHKACLSEEM